MRHLLYIFTASCLLCASSIAQTMKALMYNTNGQVVYSATNILTFPEVMNAEQLAFSGDVSIQLANKELIAGGNSVLTWQSNLVELSQPMGFSSTNAAATTRANLGFSTSLASLWMATNASNARSAISLGATWLTNTNVTNFRTAIQLGATNNVVFQNLQLGSELLFDGNTGTISWNTNNYIILEEGRIGAGAPSISNDVIVWGPTETLFRRSISANGNIVVTNQTTASNGLLFVYRTNNEPFLGLANLIASNNTTVSNETLFRVGVAEATNRSAQFGFRATNTNGNGVAVFSVFGYNALMQIGADASTNAVIFSGGGTNNEVMTLIRDGATEFARPLRFSTNASTRPSTNAPANTTNVAAWVEMRIGTNSYRVPLYQ